jgi:hypothetical protein
MQAVQKLFETPTDVINELQSESVLNQARRIFSFSSAAIEQATQQQWPPGPIEIREKEFDAVVKIAALLGVELKPGQFSGLVEDVGRDLPPAYNGCTCRCHTEGGMHVVACCSPAQG